MVFMPSQEIPPPKAHATVPPTPRPELPVRGLVFQHNLVLGRAASTQLERVDLDSPTDSLHSAPTQITSTAPPSEIFFKPEFDLGDPRTFDAVAKVPPSSASYPTSASSSTSHDLHDPTTRPPWPTPAPSSKSSHHVDTLELHLVHEIAESALSLARVQALGAKLTDVGENGARRRLRGVVETVGVTRGPVDGHEWGTTLDSVDDLRGMWDSAPTMPPSVPSRSALPLLLRRSSWRPSVVKAESIGLAERIQWGPSSLGGHMDMADKLRPLIHSVVRESPAVWRDVVLEEVQGIVQQHVSLFDAAEDPQKESADASWISSPCSMTHQELQSVLRSVLKSFLNCVEELQALNGNITEVIESIRPSELTAIHDSLFDTLSSSAEATNVLTSKVRKHLRTEERSYSTVPATQETLLLLTDYLKVINNLDLLTTDTMSCVIGFLKAFNSRMCQFVLGAGAVRSAGLKNITAKHLALTLSHWQFLSIVIALVPYMRETFQNGDPQRQQQRPEIWHR
ncbi:Vps54-like protein-domain-containing protein [Lactarius sanguifluus]|nr:Vps54-like protein-domain-containing protein [Lactarius sanguifluus]